MNGVQKLGLNGNHFNQRINERRIEHEVLTQIASFSPKDWSLICAEVRTDTGKFVNSTWEFIHDKTRYWIVIGFGNVVETIVRKDTNGEDNVVRSGPVYDFVSKVNSNLMETEN